MQLSLHHVAIKANGEAEFNKAMDFYQNVLGLPFLRRWGEGDTSGGMLAFDNVILEIVAGGTDSTPNSYWRHIAIRCATPQEVDRAAEKMAAAGCQITKGPFDKNLGGSYPIRTVFCNGPLGEELEFFYAEVAR